MPEPSENRAEVAHPMHCLDIDVDVLVEIPSSTDVFETFTGRKWCHSTVVDTCHVQCCRCEFVPIVRSKSARNYRPCAQIHCRFAGDVTRIQRSKGGVGVVRVERHACADPVIDIDLDDVEHIGMEC